VDCKGKGALVKLFQDRETLWVGDVGEQGSNINDCLDGIRRERDGEGTYDIEELFGILDI
jgi:hypothetical protein